MREPLSSGICYNSSFFRALAWFRLHFGRSVLRNSCMMPDEGGRPSTIPTGNPAITRVIACLRRIGVDSADIVVPDIRSDTRSVPLLALENIVLHFLLISPSLMYSSNLWTKFVVSERSDLTSNPLSFEHRVERSTLLWIRSSLCHRERSLWLLVRLWNLFFSLSPIVISGASSLIADYGSYLLRRGLIQYDLLLSGY